MPLTIPRDPDQEWLKPSPGGMFWLIWKKFSGLWARFRAFRRAYLAGPYAARIRSSPSSPPDRKLTYTDVCQGSSADQRFRTHSRSASNPSAVGVEAPML